MSVFAKIKHILGRIFNASGLSLLIINIGLGLLLFCFSLFLGLYYYNVEFSLPKFLEDMLKQELKDEGIILDSKEIRLDFRGNIKAKDISLKFVSTQRDFMQAENIRLRLDMGALFDKGRALKSIFIGNADLFSLDEQGEEALISNISLSAKREEDIWSLRYSKAKLGELSIKSFGNVDNRFFPQSEERKETSVEDYIAVWEDVCQSLLDVKKHTDTLTAPSVVLEFNISKDFVEYVHCKMSARDFCMPIYGKDLSVGSLDLDIWLDANSIAKEQLKIYADVGELSFDRDIRISSMKLDGILGYGDFEDIEDFCIEKVAFNLSNLELYGSKIGYLSLYTKDLSLSDLPNEMSLYLKRGDSHLDLDLSMQGNALHIDFDLWDNPYVYLEIPELKFLKNFKIIKEINIVEPLSIKGRASVEFNRNIENWGVLNFSSAYMGGAYNLVLTAFLRGENIDFASEHIEDIYGRVELDLNKAELLIDDIYIMTSDAWAVEGAFSQGLDVPDYMIKVKGRFDPSCLDNVMANWWKMVFSNFELLDYPYAEVYVNSRWGDPEFTYSYSKVDVAKAKYHSYPFEDISLFVNVNPSIICAYDVSLTGGDGYAKACLSWSYDPNIGLIGYFDRRIDANLYMNRDGIEALGGKDVEGILDIIDFEDNVFIDFSLKDINPRRDPNFEQEIDFVFDTEGSVKVSYFNFDKINGGGNAKGESFYLKNISAEFLDGDLFGDFSLEKEAGKYYFKTKIQGTDLNQGKLLSLIVEISKGEDAEEVDESNFLGKVGSDVSAEGFLLEFDTYKAQGTINVENEELKKLSILGGISRALESLAIPLTTLEFNKFKGDFLLENAKVHFPSLELSSDTSTVFGKANYTPRTDELSARMYLNWEIASTIPIIGHIVDFVSDPILDSVLIVISNTLADPSYSVRVRPFNIFNSSETMIDNIDEDLL